MTRCVVRVRHLTTGWLRWRAECTCRWRSASNSSRAVAEQAAADHAFNTAGTVEMGGTT